MPIIVNLRIARYIPSGAGGRSGALARVSLPFSNTACGAVTIVGAKFKNVMLGHARFIS
jgi:hypothetical protein